MKIVEGIPPKGVYHDVAMDLEIFQMDRAKLHRPSGKLACLSICPDGETVYIVEKEKDIEKALSRVSKARWIFHNAAFDLRHLRRWADVRPKSVGKLWDTMLLERIMFSGYYESFGLSDLARRYLQVRLPKDIREDFAKADKMTPEMLQYAATDPVMTWKIFQMQASLAEADESILSVWEDIDCPALWAILDMKGVLVDRQRWMDLAVWNREVANEIKSSLGFNPGSPQQVKKALQDSGIYVESTGEEYLIEYKGHPLVDNVLQYRKHDKLAGTYGDKLAEKYIEEDGRIYANFEVTEAKTGRMTSDSPNMQNIPRDKRYRECFIAGPGNVMMIFDYNQQEPRITAQLSQDKNLLKVFKEGGDSHLAVTKVIYENDSLTKENKAERGDGKAVNLGLVYGLTSYGLAERINKPEYVAARMIRRYFDGYPGVERWMTDSRNQAFKEWKVRTLMGRIQHLNCHSKQWENHAVNTPVQGTAANQVKIALKRMHKIYGAALPLVLIVHDEFVAETAKRGYREVYNTISECMEWAASVVTPDVCKKNLVDAHVGKSWADKG